MAAQTLPKDYPNKRIRIIVPYDPIRDFTPVTQLVRSFGQVLVVHPTVPVKSVKELLALARQRPGQLNYASFGIGNITYIAAEWLKAMTGVNIVAIQYKGVGASISDLVGGHVDMCFAPMQAVFPLIQSGKLRAVATTGTKRQVVLPDVPTMQGARLKDFEKVSALESDEKRNARRHAHRLGRRHHNGRWSGPKLLRMPAFSRNEVRADHHV